MYSLAASFQKMNRLLGKQKLNGNNLLYITGILSRQDVNRIFSLLDDNIYPLMRKVNAPIPHDSIKSLKKNFSEKLGKTISNKSLILNSKSSKGFKAARGIGLTDFLNSAALRTTIESCTGKKLLPGPGMQVLCYAHGDYVSPHNDHHPEDSHLRKGYIDVHFMFSNRHVAHQFLIAQNGNHLNQVNDLCVPSSAAVYQLPFWHQVTPLQAKPKQETKARRWLIMASYVINE